MSEENKRVEFIDEKPSKKEAKKGGGLMDLLNGSLLNHNSVSNQLPYILFLAFLALFYIANRYRFEKIVRSSQAIQIEVKNLRAESITTAAQLMNISKQSQVVKELEERGIGLKESVVPPKKIKARL